MSTKVATLRRGRGGGGMFVRGGCVDGGARGQGLGARTDEPVYVEVVQGQMRVVA